MKVIYTTDNSIAEELILNWFEKIKSLDVVHFSNSIQLNKLRLEHLKNNIIIDFIQLKDDIIKITDTGEYDYFPEGFFDQNFDIVVEISKQSNRKKLFKHSDFAHTHHKKHLFDLVKNKKLTTDDFVLHINSEFKNYPIEFSFDSDNNVVASLIKPDSSIPYTSINIDFLLNQIVFKKDSLEYFKHTSEILSIH
jgi:hypothetical protein